MCIFDVCELTPSIAPPTHQQKENDTHEALAVHTFLHQSGAEAKARGESAFSLSHHFGEIIPE